ncbi:MAG: hypothetical protein J6Z82_08840 [Schwartzia sp.]|nr:hypothetical protein [Schwartzia sp. (in: firmicutes)]
MTALQAQAVQMMDGLSDAHIKQVIDFMKEIMAQNATEDENIDRKKLEAFHWLKSHPLQVPDDFDPDKERYEALREKYGPFD